MENLNGVNLGGWLVLEKWITPSLFEKTKAEDEYSFCKELGPMAESIIEKHRDNYINLKDFKGLNRKGINAVRIPVPYWLFEKQRPYIEGEKYLDIAFDWAKKTDIKILIDLHTVKGGQNGFDHGGKKDQLDWPDNKFYTQQTVCTLEKIAKKYGRHSNFLGLGLLNEPHWDIKVKTLEDFYLEANKKIRPYISKNSWVVISDSFRYNDFINFAIKNKFVLDTHIYRCFTKKDKKKSIDQITTEMKKNITPLFEKYGDHVIVGEWSLGIDPNSLRELDTEVKKIAIEKYGKVQKEIYSKTLGNFFWTYKTESMYGWGFRSLP